jgi:hypothetical protein
MSSTLDLLLAEHCDLTSALRNAKDACRQSAHDGARRGGGAWNLPEVIRNAALIIYTLCDFEQLPVIIYLRGVGVSRRWATLPDDDLAKLVEELFLATDLTDMVALTRSGGSSDPDAMRIAMDSEREWRVVRWGMDMNACGVAPSTSELLCQAQSFLPASACAKTQTGRPTRSARSWASRCVSDHACELTFWSFNSGFGSGGARVLGA